MPHALRTLRNLTASLTAAVLLLSAAHLAAQATPVSPKVPSQLFVAEVSGTGAPIVFIPGLSSSGATFAATVDHLKSGHQCHVLTLAGFAGVPPAPGETDGHMLINVEDALARYIRDNHLRHPVLVGHSLGGFMALEFAERYPDLTGDLVIVDALPFLGVVMLQAKDAVAAKPAADAMHAVMANMSQESYEASVRAGTYTRGMVTSDADFAKLVQWGLATDRKVSAEAMYEMMISDARPQLSTIPGRVLVLGTWAGYGGAPKESVQQTFETQYRGTKHLEVVMAGQERHFIMFDNPEWFQQQIDTFLSAGATQRAAR